MGRAEPRRWGLGRRAQQNQCRPWSLLRGRPKFAPAIRAEASRAAVAACVSSRYPRELLQAIRALARRADGRVGGEPDLTPAYRCLALRQHRGPSRNRAQRWGDCGRWRCCGRRPYGHSRRRLFRTGCETSSRSDHHQCSGEDDKSPPPGCGLALALNHSNSPWLYVRDLLADWPRKYRLRQD